MKLKISKTKCLNVSTFVEDVICAAIILGFFMYIWIHFLFVM